jgi:hypothetical protein
MRLGIASAVTSALIGFLSAAVPLSAVQAQAPAAPAATAAPAHLTTQLDTGMATAFLSKFKAPKTPDPTAAAAGMAAAPAMITAAGVDCTLTEARLIGTLDAADKAGKVTFKAVEAACKNNLGFIFLQANNDKPTSADCLAAKALAGTKASSLTCELPANNNIVPVMQALLVRARSTCMPTNAVYIGEGSSTVGYEVACQSGDGVIVQITLPRKADSVVQGGNCFAYQQQIGADKPWGCKLTTQEASMGVVKALAAKATPSCVPTKERFIGALTDGTQNYEFVCQAGNGIVVQADPNGGVKRTLTCGQAGSMCTMTVDASGVASAAKGYTDVVKVAGLPTCEVAKFQTLPLKAGVTQAVEVTCESGLGGVLVSKDGKDTVFNCGRVMAEGYSCSLNGKEAANQAMTAQLKAQGKNTCTVSGVSPLASATSAYIEVACSDGAPGYMIKYPRASNEPADGFDVYTCANAKGIGGGCKLPTNKIG